jgi:hypothetical protein
MPSATAQYTRAEPAFALPERAKTSALWLAALYRFASPCAGFEPCVPSASEPRMRAFTDYPPLGQPRIRFTTNLASGLISPWVRFSMARLKQDKR